MSLCHGLDMCRSVEEQCVISSCRFVGWGIGLRVHGTGFKA